MGEGKPLLILHGLFGSLDNWVTLGRRWSEDYAVYLLDLRNHGKSPHTDSHTIEDMVDDLVGFIHDHNLDQPVLLGHSMGGKVVMEMALSHPELVGGVIIVDISPRAYERGHDYIFEGIRSLDMDQISSRQEIEEILSQSIKNLSEVLFMSKNINRSSSGFSWKINVDVLERDYENIIAPIDSGRTYQGPALLIKGELSRYVKPEDGTLLEEYFPKIKHITILGAGHWVHADRPDEFEHVVRHFMEDL